MSLKARINTALLRATGHELRKPAPVAQAGPPALAVRRGDRLLTAPAFVLCTVRSGSTLLRVLLDSHPEIHSPHELHLRDLRLNVRTRYAADSLREVGLDRRAIEHLLWDRLLQRELAASGKRVLVNKTPSDVFVAERILECWPDARFIYLLRHPFHVARSRAAARPQDPAERNVAKVVRYGEALESARRAHPGITVRYEDLARDPAAETRRLCAFLGVAWEARMLDYGRYDHGRFKPGLGDWSEQIRSGRVRPPGPSPAPEDVPAPLRELSAAWGYLEEPGLSPAASARSGSSAGSPPGSR